MESVRHSVDVKAPLEEAHRRWLDFVGGSQSASSPSSGTSAQVPPGKLPTEVEAGKVYFNEEASDATRLTMELQYNPQVLQEQDLTPDWIEKRIELYLTRFKDEIER